MTDPSRIEVSKKEKRASDLHMTCIWLAYDLHRQSAQFTKKGKAKNVMAREFLRTRSLLMAIV